MSETYSKNVVENLVENRSYFNPNTRIWEKYVDDPVFEVMKQLKKEKEQLRKEKLLLSKLAAKATGDLRLHLIREGNEGEKREQK